MHRRAAASIYLLTERSTCRLHVGRNVRNCKSLGPSVAQDGDANFISDLARDPASQQNTGNKFLFSCFFYTSAALSRRTNMAENSRPPFEHQVRAVATPNANKYNVRIRETTTKREREKCAENK